jgi:tetratricopeptide (TPR) repeat protein
MRLLSLFVLLLALNACSSLQTPAPVENRSTPSAPTPTVTPLPPPEVPRPFVGPPAPTEREVSPPQNQGSLPAPETPVSALTVQIDAAIAANEMDRAAALCERALRIAPRDPQLWYRLSQIRWRQGRHDEAAGLVQRALSYAGNDAILRQALEAAQRQIDSTRP